MNRNRFDILLDNYLSGSCTEAEKQLVEQWYALLDNDVNYPSDIETLKNIIWEKVQAQIQPPTPIIPLWQRPIFKYLVAASWLLILGWGLDYFINKEKIDTTLSFLSQADVVSQKNTSDKVISLFLEDSSKVDLSPNAEISYPRQFMADKREVTLRGEAFFQVTKNPLRPFLVYANGTITKVLGTSFTIQAFDTKTVTVAVRTGKVSVYTASASKNKDPETQGVVLTPNQKAVLDLKTDNIQKAVIEKPTALIPLVNNKEFEFTDAPVVKILSTLEKMYGIDLIYDEELLKNCTLTTSLTDVAMFDKLKIICSAIGAHYKEIDAQIVITAQGCE